MREGETWETIPQELLEDCAQLTKANSIEGRTGNAHGTAESDDTEGAQATRKTTLR